jgi:DNA damage-binding protein 1
VLHDYELKGFETGQSIANCSFDGGISDVYVVGTVTAIAGQEDVHEGRILVLHLTHDRKLSLLCSKQVEGSPYCIRQLGDKLVVAVNGTVIVYEWQNQSLNYICSLRSNTIIVDMTVNGNQIVVADLMRSVTKLEYNDSARTLQEVAFDFNPNWMTSIVLPDSDTIIGAEVGYNLFTMGHIRHNTVEGSGQLELLGEWHLGEYVNRFRHGKTSFPISADSAMR